MKEKTLYMKKLILFLCFPLLICCENINNSINKFAFDSSKLTTLTKYDYKYDSGKLTSETEIFYSYFNNQLTTSMLTKTDYEYNNKGLLIKETSKADFEDSPSFHLYHYDNNDSLKIEMRINNKGDTITWDEYSYFPDGKKRIFHRDILRHFDSNSDMTTSMENPKMDTTQYRIKYEVKNSKCTSQQQFNKKGELTKTVNFEYKNDKLIKETHFTIVKSLKVVEKITYYNYSKSKNTPDYFSLDSKNDTLEFCKNTFKLDKLFKKTTMYNYGKVYIEDYYVKGLLIGTIDFDREFSQNKITYIYEYNKNGLLMTEKSYREKNQ